MDTLMIYRKPTDKWTYFVTLGLIPTNMYLHSKANSDSVDMNIYFTDLCKIIKSVFTNVVLIDVFYKDSHVFNLFLYW